MHLRGEQPHILLDKATAASQTLHHEILMFVEQVDAGVTDPVGRRCPAGADNCWAPTWQASARRPDIQAHLSP